MSPQWVEATWRDRQRLDEADYALVGNTTADVENILDSKSQKYVDTGDSLSGRTNQFQSYHFFLAGWPEYDEDLRQLSAAIRKNWGTIYWELDFGRITHVVVKDHFMDERSRYVSTKFVDRAAHTYFFPRRNAALSRTSGPTFVSPSWVMSSLREGIDSDPRQHLPKASKKKSAMFESCDFRLHINPRGGNFVDFDEQKLEKIITSCGGRIAAPVGGSSKEGMTTFHVRYGGSSPPQLDEDSVTPLWLMACEAEGQMVDPQVHPELFLSHSTTFPWRKFQTKGNKVCITGLEGGPGVRAALACLLRSMGGIFHDSLRTNTTHLLCVGTRFASTSKYEKAMQSSSVHVVAWSWLLAVLEEGDAKEELHAVQEPKK